MSDIKLMNVYKYHGITIAEIDKEIHSKLMKFWTDDNTHLKITLPDNNIDSYLCYIKEDEYNYWDAIYAMQMSDGYHLFGESFNHKTNALKWLANEYKNLDELLEKDKGV